MPIRALSILLTLFFTSCLTAVVEYSNVQDISESGDILFVGNSLTYSNNLPGMVEIMMEHDNSPKEVEMVAQANYSLQDHYSNTELLEKSKDGWDWMILQQGPSSLPENQAHLATWTKRWVENVDTSKTKVALYMVWPSSLSAERFPMVVSSYRNASEEAGILLIPVGEVWLFLIEKFPALRLYGPDNFHPTEVGSYVAALVISCALSDRRPEDIPAKIYDGNTMLMSIDDDTKTKVNIAINTVLFD